MLGIVKGSLVVDNKDHMLWQYGDTKGHVVHYQRAFYNSKMLGIVNVVW